LTAAAIRRKSVTSQQHRRMPACAKFISFEWASRPRKINVLDDAQVSVEIDPVRRAKGNPFRLFVALS
jgi:hypothetical protein